MYVICPKVKHLETLNQFLLVLSRLLRQENEIKNHLLVEWHEPGRPHSVVSGSCALGSIAEVKKNDVVDIRIG